MFGFFLVMPLVIIIAMGNVLKRRGFYSAADIAALSKTLYWVILPLLLFRTTYISGTEVLTQPSLLISVNVCYIATIALSWGGAAFFAHKGDIRRIAVSVFSDFPLEQHLPRIPRDPARDGGGGAPSRIHIHRGQHDILSGALNRRWRARAQRQAHGEKLRRDGPPPRQKPSRNIVRRRRARSDCACADTFRTRRNYEARLRRRDGGCASRARRHARHFAHGAACSR